MKKLLLTLTLATVASAQAETPLNSTMQNNTSQNYTSGAVEGQNMVIQPRTQTTYKGLPVKEAPKPLSCKEQLKNCKMVRKHAIEFVEEMTEMLNKKLNYLQSILKGDHTDTQDR